MHLWNGFAFCPCSWAPVQEAPGFLFRRGPTPQAQPALDPALPRDAGRQTLNQGPH